MGRIILALLISWGVLSGDANSDYLRAKEKLDLIQNDQITPGERVSLTADELNAYVSGEIPKVVPDGIRNPRLELGEGRATGSALVDFLALKQINQPEPNWLLATLLEGERPVSVTARIHSSSGHATVDVERVEISGVVISGSALDFLIERFLLPRYPNAKIGEPFELAPNVERLEIQPSGVGVVTWP